jgi:hypothetical protein
MARDHRELHRQGELLPALWRLAPVWNMIDVGEWKAECRAALDSALGDRAARDGFTLLAFGVTESSSDAIERMCDFQAYRQLVQERQRAASFVEAAGGGLARMVLTVG